MSSEKYPLTLHHPHTEGVTHEVANKSEDDAWRAQGWRVSEPAAVRSEDPPVHRDPAKK